MNKDRTFYFHILFDGFYNEGNNDLNSLHSFKNMINECKDDIIKYFSIYQINNIINEINNYLDNKDININIYF